MGWCRSRAGKGAASRASLEGRAPSAAELEVIREQARALAADGAPADLVPSNFRRGARFAWAALLEAARDDERPALLDSADLLLLQRSPRIASRIRARVYGPLEIAHPQLAHTLDVLVSNSFERGATAAALPVQRNTLRDRINRISEITGVDLDRAEGMGLAWLAWLATPQRPRQSDPLTDEPAKSAQPCSTFRPRSRVEV